MTTNWDVFLSESLEVRRAQTFDQVQAGLAAAELGADDLARPAGSSNPWTRLGDLPEFASFFAAVVHAPETTALEPQHEPEPESQPESAPEPEVKTEIGDLRSLLMESPPAQAQARSKKESEVWEWIDEEDEPASAESRGAAEEHAPPKSLDDSWLLPSVVVPAPQSPTPPAPDFRPQAPLPRLHFQPQPQAQPTPTAAPAQQELVAEVDDDEDDEEEESVDEIMPDADAEAAGFTLSRGAAERVEELDLAAMVDVALQLVLFFLVTATSVMFKSLEIPTPNPEDPISEVASQSQPKDLEEIEDDLILVEIDPQGAVKINHEAVDSDMEAISARLRQVRQQTGLTHALISADLTTRHRSTILALDAAEEVGLEIQLAKPAQNSL